jgi:L-alanine-DL-glutamate epimerase-like enolase superfamily enzyme
MNRIEAIELVPIRVPLKRVYRGSYYKMQARCTIVTRVFTSDGIVGEAYNADSDEEQPEIVAIIRDELAPKMIGRDATSIESAWEAMLPSTYDQLRDRRLAMQAIACVDTALWDALGKAVGQPLYKLWGGYRDRIPAIGIGGYYGHSDEQLEQEAIFFREQGFVGMKFKIGGMTPAEDERRLRVVRDAMGPHFVLMCDANQGYTTAQAIEFGRLVADIGLRWFEEPCRWYNDRRGMRDVRLQTGIPVTAGQSEISRLGVRDLIVDGAIDVSNFDASWGGGPTEWRRVAGLAASFDVQMGHHEEPHLSSHLLAAIPHGTFAEAFSPERDGIWWNMVANRPELVDGCLPLPSQPGLGWVLDESFIARYRVDKPQATRSVLVSAD